MASSTATGATISLPSFASSFEMTQQRTSPRARSTHSSRSNSREPRPRHYRPYPESNTRGAPRDERSRKRPAPIDEGPDPDGDVGMQSDPEQDGDDESSGSSAAPVKEEPASEVEQSPSPPPSAGGSRRYAHAHAHALPPPSAPTQFAPTPPASARRVSPPITIPTLPQRDAHLTLPPMLHAPEPEPYPSYHHGEPLARKRRRVTISGVAAGSQTAPRPLHRTVLERANSGYQSHNPPSATPATPTAMSGMVSPVVTPGFNMNSPGAIAQVRDTIAIRLEQKALIEQRKNGAASVSVTTPHPRTAPQPAPIARTQSSPAGQTAPLPPPTTSSPLQNTITPPTLPPPTPTALTGPPAQTQTLAHRRGKASSKLTIHTPNSSISSIQGANPAGLGLSGTANQPTPGARLAIPDMGVAIRSAPPNITKFNPAHIQRPQPAPAPLAPPPQPPRTAQVPTPLKERSVSIRRLHANSTAATTAPPAPLAIVAPGQPLTLNAPAPPSSYIATPTRTQFPPHTPHPQPPRTARPPTSPPISRNAFMAFYDAYAEVHALRAQVERMEREMDRRVEVAVREMREEIRMLREEIRRGQDRDVGYARDPYHREREPAYPREREPYPREREPIYGRERDPTHTRERGDSTYARDWDRRRAGSASVNQSPMQVDKRPLPGHVDKMHVDKPIERPVLPGPGDRLPPPPGERIPGPGERVVGPGDRIIAPGERIPPSGPSGEKLHAHAPAPIRSAMRKSPSGRGLASSLSPPSRAPSVGATGGTPGPGIGNGSGPGSETGVRTRAQARVRTKSPGGASGDKSGSG
ncbi:unnamed protein product [Rhizoctonia solani]|uniref:Uncharacterized protein n=1 Tax=Rhizoctonia solani TaxID=456999 RepID=A0A8H3DBE5_9AGAM|nr:unnamed protein product [Rhizoctonia solani]